jgi:hypothetical protein
MHPRVAATARVLGLVAACSAAGCGDSPPHLSQAVGPSALAVSRPRVDQAGNVDVRVDPDSVVVSNDAAGLVVVRVRVTSHRPSAGAVALRASLYDGANRLVGDVTGGLSMLSREVATEVQLSGPAPSGTVARLVFESTG